MKENPNKVENLDKQSRDSILRKAVIEWCYDNKSALNKYGHISDWNVSHVKNMRNLFRDMVDFNDDISKWDVSNVIDMTNMFMNTYKFNQSIENWNIQNVQSMRRMFKNSKSFNCDISKWNIQPNTDIRNIFDGAISYTYQKDIKGSTDVHIRFCK